MKKITLLLSGMLMAFVCVSQNLKPVAQKIWERKTQQVSFKEAQLFQITAGALKQSAIMTAAAKNATVFELQQTAVDEILASKPENLKLIIPQNSGTNLELELYKSTIFSTDFSVITSESNGQAVAYEGGAYYWGIIKGDNASLAAISIFNNEIMGMISSPAIGNLVLGKVDEGPAKGNHDGSNLHVIYNDHDLKAAPANTCYTVDDGSSYASEQLQNPANNLLVNCIRLYWEVNYDIFQGKGSVINATNYVTSVFNQSAIIYTNDNIPVTLSQVFVWSTTSPYTSTSTSGLLSQFQGFRNSFNGDLGNLLGYAGGGGVAAGFSGFCASNLDNSMCYSGISSSYNNFPTYSWTVMVVTHEQGHLMGSRHTHACVWNGNNTAIDNCGPTAGYGYEGSCSGAPTPTNGGTVMSYCHLTVGINLSNGFGTQPKNVILNGYNNATCLSSCSGAGCGTTAGLAASNITLNSATVNWSIVGGALSYNLQYKKSSLTTWTTVTGIATTSYNLSSLTDGTAYDYQVQAVCSSATGVYSAAATFSTVAICVDNNEPNGSKAAAKLITVNTNTSGLISPTSDADFFKFNNTASQRNIKVTLTNVPADYDLRLSTSTTLLGTSQNGGLSNETITYNTSTVGTYYIKVYGSGGANNSTACYSLNAQISATPFKSDGSNLSLTQTNEIENEISVYPNPANDELVISCPLLNNGNCEIRIFDMVGKEVFKTFQTNSSLFKIQTSNFTSGVYFVKVVEGENVSIAKFSVNH